METEEFRSNIWYYQNDNSEVLGPIYEEELFEMAKFKEIYPGTLVLRKGINNWIEALDVENISFGCFTNEDRRQIPRPKKKKKKKKKIEHVEVEEVEEVEKEYILIPIYLPQEQEGTECFWCKCQRPIGALVCPHCMRNIDGTLGKP